MCHGVKEALNPSDSIDVHYEISEIVLPFFFFFFLSNINFTDFPLQKVLIFFHSCNSGIMNLCIHYLHTAA